MLYWLSFCDPDLPEGTQFLGATIVEAPSEMAAVMRSWELGVNPGGEVASIEIPVTADELPAEAAKYLGKFVSRDVVLAEGASPMFSAA